MKKHKDLKRRSAASRKAQPATRPDLDVLQELAATHGPHFTWWAIQDCIKHKEPFPTWVMDYLGGCADRMMSDHTDKKAKRARSGKAKRTIVPRDRLLTIFDFPKQKKPGPGSPVDPRDVARKATRKVYFAIQFAVLLKLGQDPAKARKNAGFDVFGKDKDMDDRTLRKYLREEFQKPRLPVTKPEWEPVIARYYNDVMAGKRTLFSDNR